MVALMAFWCVTALELIVLLLPKSTFKKYAAAVLLCLIVATVLWLLFQQPSVATALLGVIAVYRYVNVLRLIKGRIHDKYLKQASLQAGFWLAFMQVVAMALWLLGDTWNVPALQLWLVCSYVGLALAAVFLLSTVRHIWTTRAPRLQQADISDAHLPSLTVAIPARNETDDLEACLSSLIASDYPKLEILVLDDCSQNKRTPEIIRSYAHAGVRFLQGEVPNDNWLPKNAAYEQLFEASSGEIVLFCGVDVRFQPGSLRAVISAFMAKQKTMISLIPRNTVPSVITKRESTLLQPMRYAWELALPRRLFRRPPVLSSCWLVRRELLANAGGFGAVSRSVLPEAYFARVSSIHDGYSFMQSSAAIGISSTKSLAEQRATAVRTEYPRLHRRIELVMLLSLVELIGIVAPFVISVLALLHIVSASLLLPNLIAVLLLTVSYGAIATLVYRSWLVRVIVQAPFATLIDIALLNYSMIRYEFFDVIWKERNICIPVMRVTDHLPELFSPHP